MGLSGIDGSDGDGLTGRKSASSSDRYGERMFRKIPLILYGEIREDKVLL
jgi:hypothetical protein